MKHTRIGPSRNYNPYLSTLKRLTFLWFLKWVARTWMKFWYTWKNKGVIISLSGVAQSWVHLLFANGEQLLQKEFLIRKASSTWCECRMLHRDHPGGKSAILSTNMALKAIPSCTHGLFSGDRKLLIKQWRNRKSCDLKVISENWRVRKPAWHHDKK